MKKILIIGASGRVKVVIDIIEEQNIYIIFTGLLTLTNLKDIKFLIVGF